MRNFQWGFGGPGAKPPGNFTVFDHLKHRKRSRKMYENSENFNSLWENIFLYFELMGKVFANHPPTPGGVSRSFGWKSKFSHKPDVSTYSFPIRRMVLRKVFYQGSHLELNLRILRR